MTDLQLWLSAIEIGCFFGLIALSYLLILVGAGFFNFALGPYSMTGGLATSWLVLNHQIPLVLAILISVTLVIGLAVITELGVVRPVQARSGGGELPALVSVAAVLFAVQQAAGLIFGRVPLPGQQLFQAGPWTIGSAALFSSSALLVVVTVVLFTATAVWMRVSRMGRLLRAVGDNKDAASLLGLPVGRVRLVAFILGGIIAAIAGILFASKSGVSFTSGLGWTLTGFLALVIGGTGSIWGPLLGGLLLGAVQVFIPFYFSNLGPGTVILAIALVFFALKPEGLFVRRVRA